MLPAPIRPLAPSPALLGQPTVQSPHHRHRRQVDPPAHGHSGSRADPPGTTALPARRGGSSVTSNRSGSRSTRCASTSVPAAGSATCSTSRPSSCCWSEETRRPRPRTSTRPRAWQRPPASAASLSTRRSARPATRPSTPWSRHAPQPTSCRGGTVTGDRPRQEQTPRRGPAHHGDRAHRHGMNVPVIAGSRGDVMWSSPAGPAYGTTSAPSTATAIRMLRHRRSEPQTEEAPGSAAPGEGRVGRGISGTWCHSGRSRYRRGRRATPPRKQRKGPPRWWRALSEPLVGIEPTTYSLRVNRSGRLS